MRSITFVQAFQYWLKFTAIAVPALALLALFLADRPTLGGPLPPTVQQHTTVAIDTDVVVQVAAPAGSRSPACSTAPVDDAATGARWHTLRAGSDADAGRRRRARPVVAGTPRQRRRMARRPAAARR